jgi:hypothetical protein
MDREKQDGASGCNQTSLENATQAGCRKKLFSACALKD